MIRSLSVRRADRMEFYAMKGSGGAFVSPGIGIIIMNKSHRSVVIAGNWKMNMTPSAAKVAVAETAALCAGKDGCTVVLCVPFVDLAVAIDAAKGTNVHIGAQNVHFEKKGAFTGEISADMLLETGCEYVIIGHSERRQYFGETDETVNKRVRAALDAGLKVILCLGEVLAERQSGITEEIVSMQTKLDLAGIPAEQMANVIIAYEPVWAIGTGLTATPEQAEEVCAITRKVVAGLYSTDIAEALTIQYGGSMNDGNAAELLSKVDVDGGLIGGASLVPEKFAKIVDAAQA